MDWLEKAVHQKTGSVNGWSDIGQAKFGRGYAAAMQYWGVLLGEVGQVWGASGMHVVMTGHAVLKKIANPEGDDYDAWVPTMHRKAADLFIQWADDVLFATWQYATVRTADGKDVAKKGRRVARTTRRPAYIAKSRSGLPDPMELTYKAYLNE